MLAELRDQRAQAFGCVRDDAGVGLADTADGVGVDVEMHDLEVVVGTPVELLLQARADAEHDIDALPQFVAGGKSVAEIMPMVEHTQARAVGDNGSLQRLGDGLHLGTRIQSAAAHDDQRVFGLAEQLGGGLDRVLVDRRRLARGRLVVEGDLGAASPHIPAALDADRLRHARAELAEGFADLVARHLRGRRCARPIWSVSS